MHNDCLRVSLPFRTAALLLVLSAPVALIGQGSPPPPAHDSAPGPMPVHRAEAAKGGPMPDMGMGPGPLAIPMTRMGSGTSWVPDASPMHAQHFNAGDWELMVHGVAFVTYDHQQGGPRGDTQFGSQTWAMFMASHWLGGGRLQLRGMASADPWTVTERGYPLLLQSGESFNGAALHDRQHPHDLFMELTANYQVPITRHVGVEAYAGPVGEPAVGPAAFPHRPSASGDPFAPLGHHWQDATHIAFGVVTAAVFTHDIKIEASLFNGREPDQHRADFDLNTPLRPTLDSYSGRITVNPSAEWSASAWYSYLGSPEQLEPTVSQHRMGVSLLAGRPLGARGHWSSALVYGANLYSNDRRLSNSALLETNLDLDGRNTVFGRLEYVTKSTADLAVSAPDAGARFNVGAVSIGYVRDIGAFTRYGTVGIGAVLTIDAISAALEPTYRTRTPSGFGIYLRLRPAHTHAGGMMMDHGMHMEPRQ